MFGNPCAGLRAPLPPRCLKLRGSSNLTDQTARPTQKMDKWFLVRLQLRAATLALKFILPIFTATVVLHLRAGSPMVQLHPVLPCHESDSHFIHLQQSGAPARVLFPAQPGFSAGHL